MATCDIETVSSQIQRLTSDFRRHGRCEDGKGTETANAELLDAIDDLKAEILGPELWPGAFLAPPEYAALSVACEYDFFRHVPLHQNNQHQTNGTTTATQKHVEAITSKELAERVGLDEEKLVRIMRALITNKFFIEVDEKVFAHSPFSAVMTNEFSHARLASILNNLYKASSSLVEALRTNAKSAWNARFGLSLYEYFEVTPKSDRERMAKAMVISSSEEIAEISNTVPWNEFHKVVDIGGSAGHLVAHLVTQFPHLHAVNQDLPQVINDQLRRIENLPERDREIYSHIEFETHNYYEPQTRSDADAFILRRCLHNNMDEDCVRILRAVTPGLRNHGPTARLLINEKIVPAWNALPFRYDMKALRREDVTMMISCGGKERTLEEFRTLLKEADQAYVIEQVYHGTNHYAVISARLEESSRTVID